MLKPLFCHIKHLHTTAIGLSKTKVSWQIALNPTVPESQSVKAFKQALNETLIKDAWPTESSPELKVLVTLINMSAIPQDTLKKQIKKLQLLILQKRITDRDIHLAIQKVNENNIINVIKPKILYTKESSKNTRDNSLAVEKHPGTRPKKNAIKDDISDHPAEASDLEQEKNNSTKRAGKAETITEEDIATLKRFLEKAETQEKEIKKFVLEQQRKYNWSMEEVPQNELSSGSLLFQQPLHSRRPRVVSSVSSFFSRFDRLAHPFSSTKSRKILSYDVSKAKETIEPSDSTVLLNVQYKDLFGVINCGKYAPDQLLEIVNKYENQGWKLVGDIINNDYRIIFQKLKIKGPLISRPARVALIAALLASGYFLFDEQLIYYIYSLKP